MKTIILLAGQATRMRPLTSYLNKGMIPLRGKPLLEHIIERLRGHGFTDLIVAVTLFPEQLQHYFGDGSRFGVKLQYHLRPEPSQTAGEVHSLREILADQDHFMVHYGDIVTGLDYTAMARQHLATDATATLGLVTNVPFEFGVAQLDAEGRVLAFVEKPPLDLAVNAAVDIFSRRVLDYCAPDKDFGNHVIPELMAAGEKVMGFLDRQAYWLDIGRLSDLDSAAQTLAQLE